MAKDTPEERPNLLPRLNKALREIERLKKQLEDIHRTDKPNVCPECSVPLSTNRCPHCQGE